MSIDVPAPVHARPLARPARSRSSRLSSAALTAFLATVFLVPASMQALACGQCVEDKVAVTFDAAVRARAARIGHVVVVAEVRGPAAGGPPELRDFIARSLATAAGVDPGTVRVSLDPPAAAFACDPRAAARIVAAASPRLAGRQLSLKVIRIDDGRPHGVQGASIR